MRVIVMQGSLAAHVNLHSLGLTETPTHSVLAPAEADSGPRGPGRGRASHSPMLPADHCVIILEKWGEQITLLGPSLVSASVAKEATLALWLELSCPLKEASAAARMGSNPSAAMATAFPLKLYIPRGGGRQWWNQLRWLAPGGASQRTCWG